MRKHWLDPRTLHAMDQVPADWDAWIQRQDAAKAADGKTAGEVKRLIVDQCTSLALNALRLAEYIDWRGGAGLGDHGHDAAMKHANRLLKKVRRAVGFTYP